MKKFFLRFGLSAAVLLLANTTSAETSAETFDFTSGFPAGWISSGTASWSWYDFGGDRGGVVRADVRSMSADTRGLLKSAPLEKPKSGNVFVSLKIRNEASTRNDYLQIVGTTNNWVSTFSIGGEISRYDASTSNAWRQVSVNGYIDGLAGRTDFRLGFQAKAGGISGKYIYIDHVVVSYKASATPQAVRFCDEFGNELVPVRGDTGNDFFVAVDVLERPPNDITNLVVFLQHIRNGVTNTWTSKSGTLGRLDETSTWRSEFAVSPFEAGETNSLKATTTYTSKSELDTLSSETAEWNASTVPGLGGVWINEVDATRVELSAPTNRTTLAGWTLLAKPETGNAFVVHTFSESLVFTNGIYNGVGYLVADLDLSLQPGVYAVKLVNSAGFVEASVSGVTIPLEVGSSFCAQGNVPWLGANWDWTNTAEYFTWANAISSFGKRNPLQGVNVETLLNVEIQAVVVSADAMETNGLASAKCDIAVLFSGGNVSDSVATGIDGSTDTVQLLGTHADETVDVGISATAFGWASEPGMTNMVLGATVTNFYESLMLPSVAADSFDSGFSAYWTKTSPDWWSSYSVSGNMSIRCDLRSVSAGSTSRLDVSNPLRTHGKRYASLSFKTLNTMPSDPNWSDIIRTSFGTGTVWSASSAFYFPDALNRYPSFLPNSWVDFIAVREMPSSVLPSSDLMFSIQGIAGGISRKYVHMDDLRIAFQDMVTAENLRMEPTVPKSGQGVAVSVDLVPWAAAGAAVSNVSAKLYYQLNGGATSSVDFKIRGNSSYPLAEDTTVTISTNEFEAAVGKFNEGDTFQYWVAVSYDADNADPNPSLRRETRYCPDNSTIDEATGAWMAIGTYAAIPRHVVAMGVQPIWFNEVCPNPTNDWAQHFVELAGVTNTAIGGWTLEVHDLAAGETLKGTHVIPAGTEVTSGRVNDYGFYVFGGSGVNVKNQALTCALPAVGGLILKDSAGYTRYAYNYSATGESVDVAGYKNLGSANGYSLIATGDGNPANRDFAWTDASSTTPGGLNPNQSFTNGGPEPISFTSVIPAQNSISVSVAGSDLDKPVEYRLKLNAGAWSSWSTNRTGYLFEALEENTHQTLSLQARDSKANESAIITDSFYTLLAIPDAPAVSGTATDAVTVSASVPNLGVGSTALMFEGTAGQSVRQAADEWTLDGLAVNTQYRFAVMAWNGAGVETDWSEEGAGYTLALAPTATVALEKSGNQINLDFSAAVDPETNKPVDGNPVDTKYAVRVESAFKDKPDVNTYIKRDGNTGDIPFWQTLPEWQDLAMNDNWGAHVDITATNIAFRLVACNGDYIVTVPGPETATFFEMAIFHDNASQILDGNGLALVSASLSNPWTNACNVGLSYSSNAGVSWSKTTLTGVSAAYGGITIEMPEDYQIRGVETDFNGTNAVQATWDARTDIGSIVSGPIWLKWDAEDPAGGKPADSVIVTNAFASLDLEPPSITTVVCNQSSPTKVSPLTFTVTFSEPVTFTNHAAISVSNGDVASVTASPSRNDIWIISVTPSSEGDVSVTAIAAHAAADVVGNRNAIWSDSPITVTYDSEAPEVSNVEASPSPAKPGAEVSISFDVTDASAIPANPVVKVNTRTATFVSKNTNRYTYSYTVQASDADGAATIAVSATDAAGNMGTGSNNTVLTVDKTAPAISNFAASPSPAKQGAVVSISFDVTDASTIPTNPVVTVNTRTATYVSKTGNRYTYSYTVQAADADGAAAIAVSATDAAGNTGTESNNTLLTVDKTAPAISSIEALLSPAKLGKQVTLTFTASDATSGINENPTVTVNTHRAAYQSKAGNVYTYTYKVLSSDADGAATISVTAVDVAGNSATLTDTAQLTIDKTDPAVSKISASPSPAKLGRQVTLTFTASDATSGINGKPTVTVNTHPAAYLSKAGNDYTYTYKVLSSDVDGAAAISVTAVDVAGNSATLMDSTQLTVDKTGPVVSKIAASPSSAKLTTPVSITFTALDATSSISDTPAVTVNGRAAAYVSKAGNAYTYTFTTRADDPEGPAEISVEAVDGAGNSTTVTENNKFSIDLTAPAVTLKNAPAALINDVDVCVTVSADDVNASNGLTLSWRVGLEGPVAGLPWIDAGSSARAADQWVVRTNGLAAGTYQLQTKVVDEAGNAGTANHTWTIDLTPPTCAILTNGAAAVKDSAEFAVKFSEAVRGLDKSQFTVFPSEGSEITLTENNSSNYTAAVTGFAPDAVAVGLALPARVCSDIAGNKNEAGALVQYKVDGVAPVIKNVMATPARVQTGAAVTLAFDVVDASVLSSVTVNSTTVSGTPPHYTYTYNNTGNASVTITATDALGNHAELTVPNVFVVDNIAPIFSWVEMPEGTVNATSFESTVSNIQDDDPNCEYMWTLDGATKQAWTLVPGSSSLVIAANGLADGSHTAVVKIRDSAGNEKETTKSWTIDTTGPAVSVTAGEQTGNAVRFTVATDSGATLNTSAVYATTTAGLSAEIGSVSGSGTTYTVVVTNILGEGTITVTAPAGSVKDSSGNGNGSAASADKTVSYTKTAPNVSVTFDGRRLNANRLQWTLSSDQPLTGVAASKFTVLRSGVADADVSVWSVDVSTPATNAVITVTENDWKTAASYQPFSLVFNSDGSVTSTNGITADVITNIATEANLLIPKHGGTLTNNTFCADGAKLADGDTSVEVAGVTKGSFKYQFTTHSVVRGIAFAPPTSGSAYVSYSEVVLTLTSGETVTKSFATPNRQNYYFDIEDILVEAVEFKNFSSAINPTRPFINEIAVMGCPVARDTVGPVATVSLLGDTETANDQVVFRIDVDEDNAVATGYTWSDAVVADGLTVGGLSVTTNGFGRSYVVSLTGLAGIGTVSLSLPEGFFVDAVGNGSPAVDSESFIVDREAATAEFTAPVADNTPATGGSVVYRLQFSEPIHGLDVDDFTLNVNNATATVQSIAKVVEPDTENAYDILVAVAWSDTATVSLSLIAGAVTDVFGNPSSNAITSKTYAFEKQPTSEEAVRVVVNTGDYGFAKPMGTHVVASGGAKNIVITADEGYQIKALTKNGTPVTGAVGKTAYTLQLTSITSNITVNATFEKRSQVTVTVSIGEGEGTGTVTPLGETLFTSGADATVAVTASAGSRIESITIGENLQTKAGGQTDYLVVLPNLIANEDVEIIFAKIPDVTLTVTANEGGTALPSGTSIPYGGSATVRVEATAGYLIQSVSVNGVAKPAAGGSGGYLLKLFDITSAVAVNVAFDEIGSVDPNEIPFGEGSIWIYADQPVSFGAITLGTSKASVWLGGAIGHDPGATTEPAYLIVQEALGSATMKTLESTIDSDGKIEFDLPSGHDRLFFIGIGNADWSPLYEF